MESSRAQLPTHYANKEIQLKDPVALYLDLLEQVLTYSLWGDTYGPVRGRGPVAAVKRAIGTVVASQGLALMQHVPYDAEARENGRDWPVLGDTMIGRKRLRNVRDCVEAVLRDGVPGDFIETGVWRGGTIVMMRAVLAAHGVTDRDVWAADSFAGLPPPDPRYPADADERWHTFDVLRVSMEQVKANIQKYGLLDDHVRFLKGWFKDTLPTAPIEHLAVLRLDGDMYQSTMDGLDALYAKVSPGGFVIVDDYGIPEPGCRMAITDFRKVHGVTEEIQDIDGYGVYWRRAS